MVKPFTDMSESTSLTYTELEELFVKWWMESYMMPSPGPHAIRTHAAFALFVLNHGADQSLH